MNWILLIIAGLFETAFAICLGKAKNASGSTEYLWYVGFLICLVISMVLLIKRYRRCLLNQPMKYAPALVLQEQ